jgi:hypothetical protein
VNCQQTPSACDEPSVRHSDIYTAHVTDLRPSEQPLYPKLTCLARAGDGAHFTARPCHGTPLSNLAGEPDTQAGGTFFSSSGDQAPLLGRRACWISGSLVGSSSARRLLLASLIPARASTTPQPIHPSASMAEALADDRRTEQIREYGTRAALLLGWRRACVC